MWLIKFAFDCYEKQVWKYITFLDWDIISNKNKSGMGITIAWTWKTNNKRYCLIDFSKSNWFSVSIYCHQIFKSKFKDKKVYGIYICECYFQ